jgi:DNA-directed RNA polymerase specialized sigma24 family protein
MVLRACNQALRDPHAAEDAFQATFLVLARKARSIRERDSVASWRFGLASRAAARIQMMESRRQRYERMLERLLDQKGGPSSNAADLLDGKVVEPALIPLTRSVRMPWPQPSIHRPKTGC